MTGNLPMVILLAKLRTIPKMLAGLPTAKAPMPTSRAMTRLMAMTVP